MIINYNLDNIDEMLKDGLALPYIRPQSIETSQKLEIGYCIINANQSIQTKVPIDIIKNDFVICANDRYTCMRSTSDGYIRFWTDDVTSYLRWKLDKSNIYVLEIIDKYD